MGRRGKKRSQRRKCPEIELTAYEQVMSCYISCMKAFKMSFGEIDELELDVLLDLIKVQNKIEESRNPQNRTVYIDEILPC